MFFNIDTSTKTLRRFNPNAFMFYLKRLHVLKKAVASSIAHPETSAKIAFSVKFSLPFFVHVPNSA